MDVTDAVDGMDATDAVDGMDAADGSAQACLGPYGTAVGDVVADVTFKDCDGNDVSLHELTCQSKASFIFGFAGW